MNETLALIVEDRRARRFFFIGDRYADIFASSVRFPSFLPRALSAFGALIRF